MRKRIYRAVVATVAAMALTAAPALAITWGTFDTTEEYPAVGAIMTDFRALGAPQYGIGIYCSGTLIHPRVFLTAGHCAEGLYADGLIDDAGYPPAEADVWVSFDADPSDFDPAPTTTRCDTCLDIEQVVNSPLYNWGPNSNPHDIAAIILAEAVTDITPMEYAGVDELADLRQPQSRRDGDNRELFTVVGYGASFIDAPPYNYEYLDRRQYAQSAFQGLNNAWLRVSQNQARGDEGTCYGDSGGPILRDIEGTEVVVGVTSWGDSACAAFGFYYRVDTAESQGFIADVISSAGG